MIVHSSPLLRKKYPFLIALIFFINNSFCTTKLLTSCSHTTITKDTSSGSEDAISDDIARTIAFGKIVPYFALISPAVELLKRKRNDSAIIHQRKLNPVWCTINTAVTDDTQSDQLYTSIGSSQMIYYTTHNSSIKLKKDVVFDFSSQPSCRYRDIKNKKHITSTCPLFLIQKLCEAIEQNVPAQFICALIEALYKKRITLRDSAEQVSKKEYASEDAVYQYLCSPLHISTLRFSCIPTRQSKSIIAALIKAGASLNHCDRTEYKSIVAPPGTAEPYSTSTPLELLTDDELKELIQEPADYIQTTYATLLSMAPFAKLPVNLIIHIMSYVLEQDITPEIYTEIMSNNIHR